MRNLVIAIVLSVLISMPIHASDSVCVELTQAVYAENYLRSELFFGMNKLSGGQVSEAEWTKFLDEVVTPAFPDGYTVVDADGRFRDGAVTISEKSKVLIVLYPKSTKNESRRKLDAIRAAYVKKFDQKSVMRMDLSGSVNVIFE